MHEKPDPELQLRLRVSLREDPEGDADDFTTLVAAVLAFRDFGGKWETDLSARLGLTDPQIIHHWASGAMTPAPKFRRTVVKFLRGVAAELGVRED